MGLRLGCCDGLYEWQNDVAGSAPQKLPCPLPRVDLLTADGTAVDNAAHLLLHAGRLHVCDRDVEALQSWNRHALLLSSDTDCLSLWDDDGLVRTARVGVYPQDLHIQRDIAAIAGGADGYVHLLTLPELQPLADYPLPGMPERIQLLGDDAYLLTLLPEQGVQTALLRLHLPTGQHEELARFAGLPGAVCASPKGLWVAASELLAFLPNGASQPSLLIEGFGLIRHLDARGSAVLATDPLEGLCVIAAQSPRQTISVIHRGDVGMAVFTPPSAD